MKIYTKTGDAGQTGLADGSRVGKDALRVQAYGEVDELNAALGVILAHGPSGDDAALLLQVQRDLFAIGAQLADPGASVGQRKPKSAIEDAHVRRLEQAIDGREAELPALRAFILPGGSEIGALLHLARTVCRRAERAAVALSRSDAIAAIVLVYLNRLSDLLFVMARHANHTEGRSEERW